MAEIRAFVGHSFTDDDEDIVRKFRDHFDHVRGLGIGFSWEHAEPARSEPIAEQVMSLMSGKDVFIGICTRKELVVRSSTLKKMFLYRKFLGAKESEFQWKASDWILQEIGLARGNGLRLILLLEQDVRDPGGLRGDIEYIRFDRKSPEKSFDRITDMIKSVSPKSPGASATISDTKSSPVEEEEPETPEEDIWTTPKPEWARNSYEFAFWQMAWRKDESGAAKIDKAYREAPRGSIH